MNDVIKFFALGGLDENGKNMYVLEINEDIFVFEAGLKYPDKTRPGIDFVIPNFEYLKHNRNRIKAYIITHGHDDQFGALPFIYQEVPAPIYGSEATIMMLEKFTKEVGSKATYTTTTVLPSSRMTIADRKFIFFQTTHNAMLSFGVAVDTSQGYVVYTGDFIVEYNASNRYKLDLNSLAKIAEKDVLCLLAESTGAEKTGYTSPGHRLTPKISQVVRDAKGRIFISIYEQSAYSVEELVAIAIQNKRKLIFYDKVTSSYFETFEEHKLPLIDPRFIVANDDMLRVRDQDVIVVMLGNGQELFEKILKLGTKKNDDKRFVLKPSDTFIIACPPPVVLEVLATEALDSLYFSEANIVNISTTNVGNMHAQEEDLRMMLSLLKPKYYIPVKGFYRHQIANAKIALNSGLNFSHQNILLLDTGVPVIFKDRTAKIMYSEVDRIVNGDLMVDGTGIGDTNRGVLEDRQKLSDDGIIILGVGYSPLLKTIIAGPDVQMRGFVYLRDSELLLKNIIKILVESVEKGLEKPKIRPDEIAEDVSKNIERYIFRETRRRPMIIPLIHEL
ncbi:MAG TPA: ribonuclease J [Bacilli bacterium]|nr:ribonuclease J [Bacilli bacterium]